MSDEQSKRLTKKQCDSIWWFILILVAISIIMRCIIAFELAVFLAVCVIFAGPYLESAKTNGGEKEIIDLVDMIEEEPNFNYAASKSDEKEGDFVVEGEKIDSFYSGISEGSSIDDKAVA